MFCDLWSGAGAIWLVRSQGDCRKPNWAREGSSRKVSPADEWLMLAKPQTLRKMTHFFLQRLFSNLYLPEEVGPRGREQRLQGAKWLLLYSSLSLTGQRNSPDSRGSWWWCLSANVLQPSHVSWGPVGTKKAPSLSPESHSWQLATWHVLFLFHLLSPRPFPSLDSHSSPFPTPTSNLII